MAAPIPKGDGDVNLYDLANSMELTPRIYYVNGIQTAPRDHAVTAAYLSLLIEHPAVGIYNATAGKGMGMLGDLAQCIADFTQNAVGRLGYSGNSNKQPKIPESQVDEFVRHAEKKFVVWNQATLSLFKDLARNRAKQKMIIAHSQGNLITSNALFVMEDVLGSVSLQKVRVYSLASPSPGWPLGLRTTNGGGGRQDNAFMNDLVSLLRPQNLAKKVGIGAFQNAGDFRTMPNAGTVGLAPHDVTKIIESLNFLKSIRGDLGLSKDFSPEFLQRSTKLAQEAFPELAK